jgi:kynurenine formamidase
MMTAARKATTATAAGDGEGPNGALIVVAPLKLVEGTGSPARVLAFVPAAHG